jgi:hypothetical protein
LQSWASVNDGVLGGDWAMRDLKHEQTFRWPTSNVRCQLPVIFWACSPPPCTAARAIIHNVNFFIGDLVMMMSQRHWLGNPKHPHGMRSSTGAV